MPPLKNITGEGEFLMSSFALSLCATSTLWTRNCGESIRGQWTRLYRHYFPRNAVAV